MTPNEIEGRFEEAARTLRRVPEDRPQGYFNTWPQMVRTAWEIMAMERQPMRVWATPQAISRMEECFGWLLWLEPDEARVVWMRAEEMRWKQICRRLGVSRATAWRWWAGALLKISLRLKAEEKRKAAKARKEAAARQENAA